MSMIRVIFQLPYRVKNNVAVMNQLGAQIGTVVSCAEEPTKDTAGNTRWDVTADVEEEWAKEKLQCMEPTFPIATIMPPQT